MNLLYKGLINRLSSGEIREGRIRSRHRLHAVAIIVLAAAALLPFSTATAMAAVSVDPLLQQQLDAGGSSIVAVLSFNGKPSADTVAGLESRGILAYQYSQLPMLVVRGSAAQIGQLTGLPGLISIYSDRQLHYYLHEAVPLIGGSRQANLFGFSGAGVGVAILDSGIDGTHPDLSFPTRTVQNVKIALGDLANTNSSLPATQPVYVENVPDTDTTSGHGTHVAGIAGGDGTASSGYFTGVAPKSNLIGISAGETLVIINALEGFDYILAHQRQYNIRVVNASWGTTGAFSADDPINIATHLLHDKGITVVFAAGNDGPSENTLNPYSIAPWVIGVGAAVKDGTTLAGFSSIGVPNDPDKHPSLTAPGVDIVSARSTTPVVALTNPLGMPVTSPYYTSYAELSGTSMATPFVTGSVALLLQANPSLTPDDVKSLLTGTAQPMPGYGAYQVGAGFISIDRAIAQATGRAVPLDSALQPASASPSDGAGNVPLDQKITLTFSELLDPASVSSGTVYLIDGKGQAVDTLVSYDAGAGQITITPASGLNAGMNYKIVVTQGIRDAQGKYPLRTFGSSFSTIPCLVSSSVAGCVT